MTMSLGVSGDASWVDVFNLKCIHLAHLYQLRLVISRENGISRGAGSGEQLTAVNGDRFEGKRAISIFGV